MDIILSGSHRRGAGSIFRWHGAVPRYATTHIAVKLDYKAVDWLQKSTDEPYGTDREML